MLGSINLSEFVDEKSNFDFEEFKNTVRIAVEGLNEVLDEGIPKHPLQEQRESVRNWRQIGLGIFGLADMLIKCKITYGSKESVELCDKIGKIMAQEAILTSSNIAAKEGSYPKFNLEEVLNSNFFIAHCNDELINALRKNGLRNSQLLTIAPTGTLSSTLGVSGGVEPIFANSYTRTTKSLHGKDVSYKVYTPIVKDFMDKNGIEDEEDLPEYFITSANIPIENRIAMQAAWQSHIDASISSTVNLPKEATVEDVEKLYMDAWKNGLKGITIFRDGCKRLGILTTSDSKEDDSDNCNNCTDCASCKQLGRGVILSVSDDLIGAKRKLTSGCGSMHFEVYFDEETGEPMETFINVGSTGSCERNLQLISRLMSTALRAGVPIESIIDQCKSIKPCPSYIARSIKYGDTSKGSSCPTAIGFALEDLHKKMKYYLFDDDGYVSESNHINKISISTTSTGDNVQKFNDNTCPECGEPIRNEGGCKVCPSCGWSKCD